MVADASTPVGLGRHRRGAAGRARSGRPGLADHLGRGRRRRRRRRGGRDRAPLPAARAPRGHPRRRRLRGAAATDPSTPSRSPTPSRPSTSSCLVGDPDALLPLVRHAGAVFCGPYAPASVGDYLAGPNHVLPTYGSARFSGALRVDDFLKHVHVVSVDQAALAVGGGARDRARHLRGPRRPRRVDPSAAGRPAMTIAPRDDLALMEGYHSPQVEVAVRLNTNEAPEPPPSGFSAALATEMATLEWHRYPDRVLHRAARPPSPTTTASTRPRCSRPTARTRCSRRSASPTAARGARRPSSNRPTPCTATSPASPAPASPPGSAPTTSPSTSTRSAGCSPPPRRRSPSCARRTTPPACSRTRRRCARSSTSPRGSWSSTRPTASSPRGRRWSWSPTTAPSWSRAPTPRRGRWRPPASATSSARVRWSPSSTRWCSRTTSMP